MTENSPEYEQAYLESGKAINAYQQAALEYRHRTINDEEFLRARAAYDAAMKQFDEAYAREQAVISEVFLKDLCE